MIVFRSVLFNILFYLNLIGRLILFLPIFFLLPEKGSWWIVKGWARSSLWLLEVVAGTKACITGQENIPAGAAIIASKHQSFWEIFALLPQLERPCFILKKELMSIPLFGWYARHMGMIPVDRKKRGGALASMTEGVAKAVADNRQIVIFPEGTRTAPGADPSYRPGVYRLYSEFKLPIVPVALNSGLFWPRRRAIRQPGTITAEFLPVIEPGLDREAFLGRLQSETELHSNELLKKAYAEQPSLPMSAQVRARLDQL